MIPMKSDRDTLYEMRIVGRHFGAALQRGEPEMRGGSCRAIIIAAGCALLAACAPPPTAVRALPPGATPEEIADYARALARYRWARASGNDDLVMQAVGAWSSISEEILSRQDP